MNNTDLILAAETAAIDNINFSATELTIEASADEKSLPTFEMVAYSGGPMKVSNFPQPAVIDLAGLSFVQSVPIRMEHDAKQGVGHTREITTDGGQLVARGVISRETSAAHDVAKSGKNGFPWQASVGGPVIESELILAGQSVMVNGREQTGPFRLIRKMELKEISFVDAGADAHTAATISAMDEQKESKMSKEVANTNTNELTAIERAGLIAGIHQICGDDCQDIAAKAIQDDFFDMKVIGLEVSQARKNRADLETLRASRPKGPAVMCHTQGPSRSVDFVEAAQAWTLNNMGYGHLADDDARQRADELRARHPADLALACAEREHISMNRDTRSDMNAAFSTQSWPNILGGSGQRILKHEYNEKIATWRKYCGVMSISDFRTAQGLQVIQGGELEKVASGGMVKHGTLDENAFDLKLETYAKKVSLTRQHVINDNLNAVGQSIRVLARGAARSVQDAVARAMLANLDSDGDAFFSTGNGNYSSGSTTALGISSLEVAFNAMESRRDSNGRDLDLVPKILLCSPAKGVTAKSLVSSELIQRETGEATGNAFRGSLDVVVESRLSNPRFAGYNASNWFLLCGPSDAAITVGFLNGKEEPELEYFGLDHDADVLGIAWRCYLDYAVVLSDPLGAHMMKGEA